MIRRRCRAATIPTAVRFDEGARHETEIESQVVYLVRHRGCRVRYTATVSRFPDGRIGELFLSNHKSNSSADVNARDASIAFSFAVQHGADSEAIRRALCRDSQGNASGPLGAALDDVAEIERDRR